MALGPKNGKKRIAYLNEAQKGLVIEVASLKDTIAAMTKVHTAEVKTLTDQTTDLTAQLKKAQDQIEDLTGKNEDLTAKLDAPEAAA